MPRSEQVFQQLRQQGVTPPTSTSPQGCYELVVVHAGLAYVSGQLPRYDGGVITGRQKRNDEITAACAAAKLCLANSLVSLHQALGDLASIDRLISLRGFVNADPEFTAHGQVINAASQLALDLFGHAGKHARTSIAAGGLPANALVELEVVAALKTGSWVGEHTA